LFAQPQFTAQGEDEWLVIEESVGADLDLETISPLAANGAAEAGTLLQDNHFRVGGALLKPVGKGQSRNPTADDDDSWHDLNMKNSPQRTRRTQREE
jgi:hypothetical protein